MSIRWWPAAALAAGAIFVCAATATAQGRGGGRPMGGGGRQMGQAGGQAGMMGGFSLASSSPP